MDKKYKLNYYSFFSQDYFDEINNWNTLVYSIKTQKKYRVNRTGYVMLKYIENNPLVSSLDVHDYVLNSGILSQINEITVYSSINNFLKFCLDLEIIYAE